MSNIEVTGLGGVIRQVVNTGAIFPGYVSADDPYAPASQVALQDSFTIAYPEEPGGNVNGGLIDFAPFLNRRTGRPLIYVPWVKVVVGPGVAWNLYLTHGDESGSLATVVDNPAFDVPVANGTGNAFLTFPLQLRPKEKLRFVSGAVGTAKGYIEVHFIPVTDAYTRTV